MEQFRTPRCIFRRATRTDWPEITEVFAAAGKAAWSHILPAESLESLAPPDRWREAIGYDKEAFFFLVLVTRTGLRGFAIARPSGDDDAYMGVGEIDAFYTHPEVWGQGCGQLLMEATIGFLARQFNEATLWTEVRNERPRRFYEALGWKLDGTDRVRETRGTQLRELRYRIDLSPIQK